VVIDEDSLEGCSAHPNTKAKLYCHNCYTAICSSCAPAGHSGHVVVQLNESFNQYQPLLEGLLSKAQVEVDLMDLSLSGAQRMCSSVGDKKLNAIKEVRDIFKQHRALLEQREQEVCGFVFVYSILTLTGFLT